ncbi:DMT family transporter [Pseudomonas violetae]|uniref:DMT family transporter n=1 Tax=Pseudomonas violetae TaxID=2915813 RepID=A0ABT0ES94_9PSED|nr:DMT family transporter [Pseudomonas violetae]MCK1788599.1 DMT family transporter [Pseudomonas violetae]
MEQWTWVIFTLLAAVMQSVRTAAQKYLSSSMTPMAVTYVRYLFGLPWVVLYMLWWGGDLTHIRGLPSAAWLWILFGGLTQILGTWALVKVSTQRNFAVGSTFSKTEALQTAIIGALFLSIPLTVRGWISVMVGVSGIIMLILPCNALNWTSWMSPVTGLGLLCGFSFAISSLAVYQSSNLTGLTPLLSAALVLVMMVSIQLVVVTLWLSLFERGSFSAVFRNLPWSLFVGLCSAVGSIGWFTAMSLQNPALVRTLGQIEFLFSLLLTWFIFGERIRRNEWIGCGLIILSVLVLLLGRVV